MPTATLTPYRARSVTHPALDALDLTAFSNGLRTLYNRIGEGLQSDRHDGDFVRLVLEVARKPKPDADPAVAIPAKEFATYFLERNPAYSTTKAGISALLFETWLFHQGGELFNLFLETVLLSETEYLAIFVGPVSDNDLARLSDKVSEFASFDVSVRAGDRDYKRGIISDVTMLACKADKAVQDPAKADPNTAPVEFGGAQRMESLLPSTRQDYERVLTEGGLSTEAVPIVFGSNPFGSARFERGLLAIDDPNGVLWLSEDEGRHWTPDPTTLCEAVSESVRETTPRVREPITPVRETIDRSERRLFDVSDAGALRSVYGAWLVFEGPIEGGPSATVVAVGDRAWTVQDSLDEVTDAIRRIENLYEGLVPEFDLMAEAFLSEFAEDTGVEVSNPSAILPLLESSPWTTAARDALIEQSCVARLRAEGRLDERVRRPANPDAYRQQVGRCPDGYYYDDRTKRCVRKGSTPAPASASVAPSAAAKPTGTSRLKALAHSAVGAITHPFHAALDLVKKPEARKALKTKLLTAAKKEVGETKALAATIGKVLTGKAISKEERNAAISQAADIVKVAVAGYVAGHLVAGGVVKALATIASPADEVVGVALDKPLRAITAKVFGAAHGILPTAFYEGTQDLDAVLGRLFDEILDEVSKIQLSDEDLAAAIEQASGKTEAFGQPPAAPAQDASSDDADDADDGSGDGEDEDDGEAAPIAPPPPPPEPAAPNDHMDEPPFYREDLQGYYDMQITGGASIADALVRVRQRFKVKGLIVTPAGEVRAPGVIDRPKSGSAAPPPPPAVAAEPAPAPEPQIATGGPLTAPPPGQEPAPPATAPKAGKAPQEAAQALTAREEADLAEWLAEGAQGVPTALLRPWARLSGRPEDAVAQLWTGARERLVGAPTTESLQAMASGLRGVILGEAAPPDQQLDLPSVDDAFMYWLVYEDGDLDGFADWVDRYCPHLATALEVWQPTDTPLVEGRLQQLAERHARRTNGRAIRRVKRQLTTEDIERYDRWKRLVNMPARSLRRFLTSEAFRDALKGARTKAADLRLALESARRTLAMKATPVEEWTGEMWNWCGRQTHFISRLRGTPAPLIEQGRLTRKYVTLKAWGHDPAVPGLISEAEIIVRQRVTKTDEWVCPHCQERIHEKSLFYGGKDEHGEFVSATSEGEWFHRACKGQLELPSPNEGALRATNRLIDAVPGYGPRALVIDEREVPDFDVLKRNRTKLSDDERERVLKAEAVWNKGPKGEKTLAVWKAVVGETTWFVTNTHRLFRADPTLDGAIRAYHRVVKQTA